MHGRYRREVPAGLGPASAAPRHRCWLPHCRGVPAAIAARSGVGGVEWPNPAVRCARRWSRCAPLARRASAGVPRKGRKRECAHRSGVWSTWSKSTSIGAPRPCRANFAALRCASLVQWQHPHAAYSGGHHRRRSFRAAAVAVAVPAGCRLGGTGTTHPRIRGCTHSRGLAGAWCCGLIARSRRWRTLAA